MTRIAPQAADAPLRTARDAGPERRRISAERLVPAVLAALVVAAVGPVLALGWTAARDGSERSLRGQSELLLDALGDRVASRIAPAAAVGAAVAAATRAGALDPDAPALRRVFLAGALAAAPAVDAVVLRGPGGEGLVVRRAETPAAVIEEGLEAGSAPPAGWSVLAFRGGAALTWTEPLRDVDGAAAGVVSAAVDPADLSGHLALLRAEFGVTPFVLLGRDRVLAHPGLTGDAPAALDAVGDAALASIWADPRPLTATAPFRAAQGHWSPYPAGDPTVFLLRALPGYGDLALTVGFHYPSAATRRDRWVKWIVLGMGLVLLGAATLAAAALGRAIARPVTALAEAAGALEESRFAEARARVAPVAQGRVRETAAAAEALSRAAEAIALFEAYAPRTLVRKLLRSGPEAARPRAAEIAVLFLDLEGFSALAAAVPPAEAVALLDAVFSVAGPRIEASGGVVDKFTGDGLLAIWGAPEPHLAPARPAVEAALGLIGPLGALVAMRRHEGLCACRVRIGVQVGRGIVGDLGYPGRVNYTAVGAPVNDAARAQAALRGVDTGADAILAVTDTAMAAAGPLAGVLAEPVAWGGAGRLLRLRPAD